MSRKIAHERGRTAARWVVVFALWCSPTAAVAQQGVRDDLGMLGLNTAVGALSAGIVGVIRGHSFIDAALGGAAGGALSFGGKRLLAYDDRLGLPARSLAALGASVTANAAHGRAPFHTLWFPVGPLRLEVSTQARGVRTAVDLNALAWTLFGIVDSDYRFDVSRSLQSGALVFLTYDLNSAGSTQVIHGKAGDGVVLLSEVSLRQSPTTLLHETVHVLQVDYLKHVLMNSLESHLLDEVGLVLPRSLNLGIAYYPMLALLRPVLEAEATRLEGVPEPR